MENRYKHYKFNFHEHIIRSFHKRTRWRGGVFPLWQIPRQPHLFHRRPIPPSSNNDDNRLRGRHPNIGQWPFNNNIFHSSLRSSLQQMVQRSLQHHQSTRNPNHRQNKRQKQHANSPRKRPRTSKISKNMWILTFFLVLGLVERAFFGEFLRFESFWKAEKILERVGVLLFKWSFWKRFEKCFEWRI